MAIDFIKNIFIFSLNIVSTIIYVNSIPGAISAKILFNYSLASGLISFVIVYTFSNMYLLERRKIILLMMLAVTSIHSVYVGDVYLVSLYAYFFILTDYISTQAFVRYRSAIRIISFGFNLLIPIGGIFVAIHCRVIMGAVLLIYYILFNDKTEILKIKNPNTVIIKSNFLYFGSLALLSNFVGDGLQQIYTAFQFGLSYALKLYDFKLRFVSVKSHDKFLNMAKVMGLIPISYIMYVDFNYAVIALYVVTFFSLMRLEEII